MFLSRLAPLLILPFVAAEGVHKLKLQKLQPVSQDFTYESAHLAEKYGGQHPLMGSGGAGRNIRLTNPIQPILPVRALGKQDGPCIFAPYLCHRRMHRVFWCAPPLVRGLGENLGSVLEISQLLGPPPFESRFRSR